MNQVYISLGSNLGNRSKSLKLAIHKLSTIAVVEKISSFIETKAQEVKEKQPKYVNAMVKLSTHLPAQKLLSELNRIEKELGRELLEKGLKKSRPIDLDIVSYNDEVIESAELTVPHPRMHERDFVLIPLAEIDPEWNHPVLKLSVTELLKNVQS